jgi:hypothetical protein
VDHQAVAVVQVAQVQQVRQQAIHDLLAVAEQHQVLAEVL